MSYTLESFAVSVGVNALIAVAVFVTFGVCLRCSKSLQRFYAAKSYVRKSKKRPKPLPRTMWGWIPLVLRYTQKEVVELAGYDAAMYLRILSFGIELFTFVTIWVCLVVLPTNLSGHQVQSLVGRSAVEPSNFTYWVPPPPPPAPPGQSPPTASSPPKPIKAPDFYDDVPPAPPGLEWWHYKSDVPPLPEPSKYFHSQKYRDWGWRYDKNFQVVDYTFSKLDFTTMANISSGDDRLWVHLLSCWVISCFVWRLLWRYNREAVALRIAFFMSAAPGGVAHTALVTNIPGLPFGTLPARIGDTALRFLPGFIRRRIMDGAVAAHENITRAVSTVVDAPARVTNADASVHGAPVRGIVSGATGQDAQLLRGSASQGGEKSGGGASGEGAGEDAIVTEVDAWDKAVRALQSGLTPQEMTKEHFERLFPGRVQHVHMAYDLRRVKPLVKGYFRTRDRLLDALDELRARRDGRSSGKSKLIETVDLCKAQLQEIVRKLQSECQHLRENPRAVLPAAFITFHSREAQAVATTSMLHQDRTAWIASAAPEPRDVIWSNLGWRLWELQLRAVMCWAVFFAMVAFYLPVVTAVQAILQIEKLVDLPLIRQVMQLPLVSSLVAGLLPQVVLRLFFALMPYILAALERLAGRPAESEIEWGVVRKYFSFQVMTIFFATFIAGSFLNQVQLVVSDPTSIVRILGAAAPQTASFFMSYLLLLGLATKPVLFLRLPALAMYWASAMATSSERARMRLRAQQYIDFGYEIPDNLMAVLLGLTFCVVSPLIAPIALVYFLINSMIGRYNLVYVYTGRFESGGKVWREVSGQIFFAVLTFQLVMLGLLLIKGAPVLALLAALLPVLTISFWRAADVLFTSPQEVLSIEAAVDLDSRDQEQGLEGRSFQEDMYDPPPFSIIKREAARPTWRNARVDAPNPGAGMAPQEPDVEGQQEVGLEEWDDDADEDGSPGSSKDALEAFYPASSGNLDDQDSAATPLLERRR